MTTATAPARRDGEQPFIISRAFPVPRPRLWSALTSADEMRQWFGPQGTTVTVCKVDLRPGGICHYCLRTADGGEMWGKQAFREVVAPQRLVLVQTFSDAQGGITRHPLAPTWPLETHSTATLTEQAGATTLEIRWLAWNGTEEEHRTFDGAHDGMRQGWGGSLDRLATYLARP